MQNDWFSSGLLSSGPRMVEPSYPQDGGTASSDLSGVLGGYELVSPPIQRWCGPGRHRKLEYQGCSPLYSSADTARFHSSATLQRPHVRTGNENLAYARLGPRDILPVSRFTPGLTNDHVGRK
jgi:hypothetical protein